MVQRLKELHRIYKDHNGSPDPIDDHLPKRVLGNVCNILEPLGNTEGFRSIENKFFPTKTNKNSQDLIYEMQKNEQGNQIYIPL
jgi:hypothetical protein